MLKLTNVSKSFGNKQVLSSITMEIQAGAPVAIIGPNGAGKTTLFSIIAGFIQPDAGDLAFMGHTMPSHYQFGRLTALPQDAQLAPGFSVSTQLQQYCRLQGMSKSQANAETKRVLTLVGMANEANKKPQQLSHGMRKRVCIAQALIGRPQMVLLDEATAGLDPVHAREIRELINSLSEQVTFILSSHDLSELERLCERVFVFADGKLRQYVSYHSNVSDSDANELDTDVITIRLRRQPPETFINQLEQLPDVVAVTHTQSKEYALEYQRTNADFDIDLIRALRNLGVDYLQLYKGKTLENQLFS